MPAAAATSRYLLFLAGILVLAVCLQVAAKGTPYIVGGADGWRVPPPEVKERYYADWAASITFYVDDSIEFVYKNDSAIMVSKAGYYHCNETAPDSAPHDGTTLFVLDAPGEAYFASADPGRCAMGERLMINVLPASTDAAAPAPWPAAPGPWSPWALSSPPAAAGAAPVQHQHSAAAAAAAAALTAHAVVVVLTAVALALAAGLV